MTSRPHAQDGISEIKMQNNKLGTMHNNNTELESLLQNVLADLSMPEDCLKLLQSGELNSTADLQNVLPAARRLVYGVSLKLADGMQDMKMVQSQKAEFEKFRSIFSGRAKMFIKRSLEQEKEIARVAHQNDSAESHPLGNRRDLYDVYLLPTVQLLQILKQLDREVFDKVLHVTFVKSMKALNKTDINRFFNQVRDSVMRKTRDCHLLSFSAAAAESGGHGSVLPSTAAARSGGQLASPVDASEAFQYALEVMLQHCHREHLFLQTLFEPIDGGGQGSLSEADLQECDRYSLQQCSLRTAKIPNLNRG